jgi:hypothetical protein
VSLLIDGWAEKFLRGRRKFSEVFYLAGVERLRQVGEVRLCYFIAPVGKFHNSFTKVPGAESLHRLLHFDRFDAGDIVSKGDIAMVHNKRRDNAPVLPARHAACRLPEAIHRLRAR